MYRFLCAQIFLFLLDLYLGVECWVIQWLYVCHFGELPEFHPTWNSNHMSFSDPLLSSGSVWSWWLVKGPGLCLWFHFLLLHLKSQKLLGSSVVTESSATWDEDCPHFLHLWKQPTALPAPQVWGTPVNLPLQKLQARSRCWSLYRNTLQLQGCVSSILFSLRMRGEEDRIPSL